MKNTKRKAGFTLVELMIVAAIIAILAAIVIPLLSNNRERAIAAEGQNICGTLASAAKVQFAESGTWPTYNQLPQMVRNEVQNAKYFTGTRTIGARNPTTGAYLITVRAGARAGALNGMALTMNQSGLWGGAIANRLNLQ